MISEYRIDLNKQPLPTTRNFFRDGQKNDRPIEPTIERRSIFKISSPVTLNFALLSSGMADSISSNYNRHRPDFFAIDRPRVCWLTMTAVSPDRVPLYIENFGNRNRVYGLSDREFFELNKTVSYRLTLRRDTNPNFNRSGLFHKIPRSSALVTEILNELIYILV